LRAALLRQEQGSLIRLAEHRGARRLMVSEVLKFLSAVGKADVIQRAVSARRIGST
jgi:hypothetical protein